MSPQALLELECIAGNQIGDVFRFKRPVAVTIGAGDSVDVRIQGEPGIADVHATLDFTMRECHLRVLDDNSSVLVNGSRAESRLLKTGDILQLGRTMFRVHLDWIAYCNEVSEDGIASTRLVNAGVRLQSEIDAADQNTLDTGKHENRITITGFEQLRLIGKGGMGTVYTAQRKGTGDKVALKFLNSGGGCERELQLFLREASVLSRLNHPRIVKFYEVGFANGQIFIAMEFVECIDFLPVLHKQQSAKRVKLACGIMSQILSALEYAHRNRLVHRDIKPSNILVSRAGSRLSAKLSDFGLAKNFESAGHSAFTEDGETRGTLAFMAPEQFQNSRYAKPAADIYSAGVTLFYYLYLSDQKQFGLSQPGGRAAGLNKFPASLELSLPDVPAELRDAISRATARDPADRFATAAEFRKAIKP